MKRRYGVTTVGLDFKDLSAQPALAGSRFVHGLLHEQDFGSERFDLITMWHFLEHDYDPVASLAAARRWLAPDGVLLIEVPSYDSLTRRWFGDRWPGLQAPQHTVLFTARSLADLMRRSELTVEQHLPYGGFPAYFYLFTGDDLPLGVVALGAGPGVHAFSAGPGEKPRPLHSPPFLRGGQGGTGSAAGRGNPPGYTIWVPTKVRTDYPSA